MKIYVLTIFILYSIGSFAIDSSFVYSKVHRGQSLDFYRLDFTYDQQSEILDLLSNYRSDSLLLQDLDELPLFLLYSYATSSFDELRQKSLELFFDLYRFGVSDGGYWISEYRLSDFTTSVKKKIINIISGVEYTSDEREAMFQYELHQKRKSLGKDTEFFRKQLKRVENEDVASVQDRLIVNIARNISSSRKADQSITPGIVLLAGWLGLKDAIPYMEEFIEKNKYVVESKYALTRMGVNTFEDELFSKMKDVDIAWCDLMYIQPDDFVDICIAYLENGNTKYSRGPVAGNIYITVPEICNFFRIFKEENGLIMDFPYENYSDDLNCDVPYKVKKEVIAWLKENKEKVQFLEYYYCLGTPCVYMQTSH